MKSISLYIPLFLLLLILHLNLHAFTLSSRQPARYTAANDEITIRISDQECSNAGLTVAQLRSFAIEALDQYWNGVTASRVTFVVGDDISVSTNTLENMAASLDEIVIGCSDSATIFTNASTLAVGGMINSTPPYGIVAINDRVGTPFPSQSELNKKATFAHEFGHAIGIGHSRITYSLMYYQISAAVLQEHLAEDDADAITYLYPMEKEWGMPIGSCGTIALLGGSDSDGDGGGTPPSSFIISLLLGATLSLFLFGPKLQLKNFSY
jgi:hypothetical protein